MSHSSRGLPSMWCVCRKKQHAHGWLQHWGTPTQELGLPLVSSCLQAGQQHKDNQHGMAHILHITKAAFNAVRLQSTDPSGA